MFSLFNQLSEARSNDAAWQLLLKARELLDLSANTPFYISYDFDNHCVKQLNAQTDEAYLWVNPRGKLCFSSSLPDAMQTLFDLYLPILGQQGAATRVVAHLGQSIDSRIATPNGDSIFVTGEENRRHLHCLRALSDAVIVGAGTVTADNPQLTTRAVTGENPVRVVIDPRASLSSDYGLFNDGQSRTLLIHQSSANTSSLSDRFGPVILGADNQSRHQVERCHIPDSEEQLVPSDIVAFLASRGLRRLFVEGGGVTVSQFYNDRALDRLHIAIAPVLVGEGIQALQLPGVGAMSSAHRPAHATYRMGEDVLWDFDVGALCKSGGDATSSEVAGASGQISAISGVQRIR